MKHANYGKQVLSWLLVLVMLMTLLPVSAFAEEEQGLSEEISASALVDEAEENDADEAKEPASPVDEAEENNADEAKESASPVDEAEENDEDEAGEPAPQADEGLMTAAAGDEYYLMNIPYAEFYKAVGADESNTDFDAISQATDKVGNYGKTGGAFHTGTSAQIDGDTVTAVGKTNGAKMAGVIWPVKVSAGVNLADLNGTEITADAAQTVATLGRGQTSATYLYGYECLMEADAYSYCKLDNEPDYYLELTGISSGAATFSAGSSTAETKGAATVTTSYGTVWGDVQLAIGGVSEDEIGLVNAMVITAKNGGQTAVNVGMVHLYNIWTAVDVAWRVASVTGLDDAEIASITYYCSGKDPSVDKDNADAPAYANHIYEYTVSDTSISKVYSGSAPTAAFADASTIQVSGLPADVANPKATVYYTSGGRGATYQYYLTPMATDPNDDDIDPESVALTQDQTQTDVWTVSITPGSAVSAKTGANSTSWGRVIPDTEYTVEISSDNYIFTSKPTASYSAGDAYVLMNIPYEEFYKAAGADTSLTNFDAVTSATNKVGNYGKTGGAFHAGTTAQIAADGAVTAVGGANGAKMAGVTWPVKVEGGMAVLAQLQTKGGKEIVDESSSVIATLGRGQTSASYLKGYESLAEAPAYSYYILDSAPANYLTLSLETSQSGSTQTLKFAAGNGNAGETKSGVTAAASYGTNWGDVQLAIDVDEAEIGLVNAMVITAEDGSQTAVQAGMAHLYNIWTAKDIAWKVASISGLDGKTITNIRYYCSVKDDTVGEDNDGAPAYQNYIYDCSVTVKIPPVYTEAVSAEFDADGNIIVTGLPEDIANPVAKVYIPGGRGQSATYLTPLEVDESDGDIDPVNEEIKNGKITISPTLVEVTSGDNIQTYGQPMDGKEYTVEISSDNWIINKITVTYTAPADDNSAYVLMNIPYTAFYEAVGADTSKTDFDAISAATDKVGNYGKTGGAFHSGESAETAEDGTIKAVGKNNGAEFEGVIWPVKVSKDDVNKLGDDKIAANAAKTIATFARGATSTSYLYGYECLMEAPAYAYYELSEVPANYLELTFDAEGNHVFNAGSKGNTAVSKTGATVGTSYGTNWGDIQLAIAGVNDAAAGLTNAVVVTTKDGGKVGLVHLYNIWSATEIAWRVATISGLDGAEITNIRYYCSVKDSDVSEGNSDAPAYANFVYDYPVTVKIPPVYDGEVTATFNNAGEIEVTGLPADIQNPAAKVYIPGGRGQSATYLTPLEVDPADQDIDPVNADIVNGKIAISPMLVTVTNDKGDTSTYGKPVDGTTYTVEISSDNWIINKITAKYEAASEAEAAVGAPVVKEPSLPNAPAAAQQVAADVAAAIVEGGITITGTGVNNAVTEAVDAVTTSKEEALTADSLEVPDTMTEIKTAVAAAEKAEAERSDADKAAINKVTLAVQVYVEVTITGATSADSGRQSVTIDITPMQQTVLTTATGSEEIKVYDERAGADNSDANAVAVSDPERLDVIKPTVVTLQLPGTFAAGNATVNHKKSTSLTFNYPGIIDANHVLTFTSKYGFSEFEVSAGIGDAVANVDGELYTSLQAAVDAVANGGTITLLADAGTATVSRAISFTVVPNGHRYTINSGTDYKNSGTGDSYVFVSDTGSGTTTNPGNQGGNGGGGSSDSGYSISVPSRVTGGTVTVRPGSASEGSRVTITAKPNSGYKVDTVTVTDKDGKQIAVTDAGNNTYTFTMPKSKVSVDVSFVRTENAPSTGSGFVDVSPSAWYYNAVQWAVEQGITSGTSANTFSPDSTCTRGQIVTFLWRAAGSPMPSGSANPFTDVLASDYYCNAVLWAVEQGITSGTSANTFSPDSSCTRAQAVMFLYRAANSPAASGSNTFADVSADAYYAEAVQWAVDNGITAGTSATTFGPDSVCTRSQIVTFLYSDRAD